MKQIRASVVFDILPYTISFFVFLNLIIITVSFVFLNLIIIAARVHKLRLVEVNFLSCY